MDFTKVFEALKQGVEFVESITPFATKIGGPIVGNVVETVKTVTAISENVIERAKESQEVFSELDQRAIKELIDRLAVQNDKLAQAIANS